MKCCSKHYLMCCLFHLAIASKNFVSHVSTVYKTVGVGKERRKKMVHGDASKGSSAPYWNDILGINDPVPWTLGKERRRYAIV